MINIKQACLELGDILNLAKTNYEEAERQYAQFEAKYTSEQIELMCDKMNVDLGGVFK